MEHDDFFERVEGVERCANASVSLSDREIGREKASVLVIVPTYNERGNVARLLSTIASLEENISFDAMVVDDGSTDGTRDAVREYAKTAHHEVYLMKRKGKFGLGNAYVDAYRWMFRHFPEYKTIVHMDADFSHDPHMIPLLVSQARAYGVAVGSRYVVGGCTPDWNWRRVLISLCGNLYMRFVLKLFFPSYPVKDNTAGFIAWKRQVLSDVLQHDIPGDGYSFLTAEKLIAFRIGFPAIEVPIVFRDRRLGVSKISKSIIIEALSMPWRLAMKFRHITFSSSLLPPPEDQDDLTGDRRSEIGDQNMGSISESRSATYDLRPTNQRLSLLNSRLWYFVPVVFAALLYLAFIIPGILNGLQPWWRIPLLAPIAPDIYLYQTWLGAVAQGLPQGQFFYWYIPIFRFVWFLTGGAWSLPEFLLLTFILSSAASILILPWTLKQWAVNLTLVQRRLLSIGFLSIWTLVLGFRPGYYSWYAPIIFFGFGALGVFRRRVSEKKLVPSICWAFLTFAAFFIYPWCLIFAAAYIAVMIACALFASGKRTLFLATITFIAISGAAILVGILLILPFFQPSLAPVIDLYHRTGVMPSHMPFITNTLLVIIGWLFLGVSGFARDEEGVGHLIGWLCLLFLWLDYPFTGFFLFNEHFMQVIAPFGLLTLGYLWSKGFERRAWSAPVFVVSIAFICMYAWKSIVTGSTVRGFMVHFINWIPLAIAAGFIVFSKWKKRIALIGIIGLIGVGFWGYVSIIHAQTDNLGEVAKTAPASIINWIRQDSSASTRYCSDIDTSTVLAAHTGRAFYPSEAMLYERVTQRVEENRFRAIAGVFDVDDAKQRESWDHFSVYALYSPCNAFPLQEKILRKVGVSQTRIDKITGCPRGEIQTRLDAISLAVERKGVALPLSSVCDRVIVREDLQPFWHLPKEDVLLTEVGGYRVYEVK